MINALWSNSNYDGSKEGENPRAEAIKDIEEKYQEAIDLITGAKVAPVEEEIDTSSPFYGAMERGRAKWDADIEMPSSSKSFSELSDKIPEIDQV